jgi:hypothetical protein
MNPKHDSARVLSRAAVAPDIDALRTELSAVLAQAGGIRDRQTRAQNTRLNRWEGQSADYRKWDEDAADGVAKPFNGAPDQRVPVVDIVVRERVALYVQALMSGEIQAQPIGGLDTAESATKMSRTLRWLRENVLAEEMRHEAELLANYVEADEPGVAILKVYWKSEPALELRDLSLDEVGMKLLEARGIVLPSPEDGPPTPGALQLFQGAVEDVGDLIFNVTRSLEAIDLMLLAFPTVQRKRLRKALSELRRTRQTTLPLPYVKENRPCVAALRYMQDIFFPSDLDDIQKARIVWEREWVSETDLRARVHSHSYDAGWVEELLEAGPGGGEVDGFNLVSNTWARLGDETVRYGDAETDKLFEVWHAYSRAANEYGIPGVYWTVYSFKVADSVGYHDLLDYPDGDYPHVLFRAENIARGVDNVRSTPERAGSMQSDIKLQRDCRGAHTMLATIPPVRVTQRRGGLEAVLGPMVEVPVREADDVTWMQPPQFPAASIEMEKAVWSDLNQYFGRIMPGVTSELAQTLLQHDADRWLGSWKKVWGKILQLQQAYGDPVELQLVAGGPVMKYSREEIRGRFAASLTFSVRDLNMDFVMSRNQAIAAILSQDMGGVVDRTVIVRSGLRGIDPNLAEQAIRDPQVVTQKEIEDERGMINMLANGIEAPLRQSGINAKLRLETLQQTVMGSPILAQRYNQPQSPADQYFKELVENRSKNLQFLVQQYTENPAVGRQGTMALQAGAGVASATQ